MTDLRPRGSGSGTVGASVSFSAFFFASSAEGPRTCL